ncbi:hypothetical protein [Aquimarina megaterium]|uniref:hypothetical protein n=1 Tax=Aquimarina megaterium TaxID=1443666 RepID=UPI00046E5911|nr:hypothetical protein [Aquimarina megaterium]
MKKQILSTIFCIGIIICSCSSDDSPAPAPTGGETPTEETPTPPEVGLKFFGLNESSDFGVNIFKTSYGYISFELINGSNGAGTTGDSDIAIRKLTDKLEVIEENIMDTSSYDMLRKAIQIDEDTYILVGSRSVVDFFTSNFPIIQMVNGKGEVLKSTIIGGSAANTSNNGAINDVFLLNNEIYLAINFDGSQTTAIVLDMNLVEKWRNTFNSTRYSKIFADPTAVYFINNKLNPAASLYNTLILNKLNISDGTTVTSTEYENILGQFNSEFNINKINADNDYLYLAGQGGRPKLAENGQIPQGTLLKVNKTDGNEVARLTFDKYWYLSDIEFSGNDIIIGGWSNRSFIKIDKIDTEGNQIWTYEYNESQNDVVSDIILNDNGLTFIGSVQRQATGDRDIVAGILKSDGTLK